MKDSTKRFAIGTLIAAAAGYVTGILTAPQSGKETRKDIKDNAVRGYKEAERQLKHLHTEMNQLIAEGKDYADKLSGKAKQELEHVLKLVGEVKEKARDTLGAVHEGTAEDKDLQKAIKDAQDAVDHLRSYLKKKA